MITRLTFANGSDRGVPAYIRGRLPLTIDALTQRVTWWMLRLQQHIQADKLQGQVLAHRSGKLAGSIHAMPTETSGTSIVGSVQGAGGPAWYGQIHEFGGRAAYEIKPKNGTALAFFANASNGRAVMRDGRIAARSVIHPPLPARPFMAPSLEDLSESMVADLQNTASLAVSQP